MSSIKKAIQIFKILIEKGQLDRNEHSDLFIEYLNTEVRNILSELEEEMECKILKISNTIYMLPDFDNDLLGFRNKDFRDWIGSNARQQDAYLLYYITMFILYKFYSGKNKNPKRREFIRIMTLIDDLDERFDTIINSSVEDVLNTEDELNINILGIAELWGQKITHDANKRTTKYGTVLKACTLLEQEKLLRLMDDKKEIRTTKKLDDLITYYFLNDSRIEEINRVFQSGGSKENASN